MSRFCFNRHASIKYILYARCCILKDTDIIFKKTKQWFPFLRPLLRSGKISCALFKVLEHILETQSYFPLLLTYLNNSLHFCSWRKWKRSCSWVCLQDLQNWSKFCDHGPFIHIVPLYACEVFSAPLLWNNQKFNSYLRSGDRIEITGRLRGEKLVRPCLKEQVVFSYNPSNSDGVDKRI